MKPSGTSGDDNDGRIEIYGKIDVSFGGHYQPRRRQDQAGDLIVRPPTWGEKYFWPVVMTLSTSLIASGVYYYWG